MSDDGIRDFVRSQFIHTLQEIQRNAGREVPTITDDTVPFDDLAGFDSLSGVESAVALSTGIAVEVDELAFVAPRTGQRMAVRDIVGSIVEKHGRQIAAKMSSTSAATTSSVSGTA